MTPEELERLAREAGFDKWTPAELVGKSALDRIAVVGEYPCGEALARFAALVRAQALEQVSDDLAQALCDDCENGVKWLNEAAAQKFAKDYPHLRKALAAIKEQP